MTLHEAIAILKRANFIVEYNSVDEDFSCGVTDCGVNQGIPYGGDGKGVVPMPLFSRKKKKKKKRKAISRRMF